MKRRLRNIVQTILPWIIPILLIITWQLLSVYGILSNRILPAPSDVYFAAVHLLKTGDLFHHVWISLCRAVIGFIIGGTVGFLFGLFNGLFKISEILFDTSIQMLRNIPHLALIPLVILWFGIGEEAKIFLVALGVLFPVYLNTYHGIKSVDPGLIEMGKIYGMKGISLFTHIIFPGALSSILVGIRFSLGIMWISLIVAETISSTSGIGYMAMNAREFMQMDVVVLSILLYALLGKASDIIARFFEEKCLKWNPNYKKKKIS
ncbi:aliphatic sulfonate ABC transporter permease SsuC [Heyndrickxia ginsengihumi]|uniref:Aliphatic sulfonate ABC transporter permease SsuC n=1 Tax=Heyndrickxia ginsengihumi TaxID=363870 RepID=A0A6M0P1B0_9BACI|nr:aliphatic sulfonate ABC transporter permease SsuC [Heyndrickxia ginsengihumi]MBE6184674.1 aliphatic sulfonate ABC transporter permease SsuC [Bacillus sp. (in: firmicutes)]MCM3022143.1 aliphatic sulfonate ABC transporter permease SsuC [Heyndrickxia ginsengihumi]NEY18374.1 aliphatic sulfonate ABC transporter permease SsuC [Heyndrickxia ginsengihumi]